MQNCAFSTINAFGYGDNNDTSYFPIELYMVITDCRLLNVTLCPL